MDIHILSDLHLDLLPKQIQKEWEMTIKTQGGILRMGCPCLILAGLKWVYWKAFLKYVSMHYDTILLVLGNHEFYDVEYDEGVSIAETIVKEFKNVHLLNKGTFIDKKTNTIYIGATLWSDITSSIEDKEFTDFKRIKNFDCSKYLELYTNQKEWINKTLEECKGYDRVFVITHHAPLKHDVNPPVFEIEKLPTNAFFCSDLSSTVDFLNSLDSRIKGWIFGHTHLQYAWKRDKTFIITNAVGYSYEYIDCESFKVLISPLASYQVFRILIPDYTYFGSKKFLL